MKRSVHASRLNRNGAVGNTKLLGIPGLVILVDVDGMADKSLGNQCLAVDRCKELGAG